MRAIVSGVYLNDESLSCRYKGERARLSPKEFLVLVCLVMNRGKFVTKEKIWEHANRSAPMSVRSVRTYIYNIRQKLPNLVIDEWLGCGYLFDPDYRPPIDPMKAVFCRDLTFDPESNRVYSKTRGEIRLTPVPLRLLKYMMRRAGRVVRLEEMFKAT